ncbi:MAG: FIG01080558: hypothetical protein, partial [uncultured Phycisphaerae bacterium]
ADQRQGTQDPFVQREVRRRGGPGRQRRAAAARPVLGAAVVPPAGQAAQAPPGRPVRVRPEPRRDRRAVVRLHHARRQRQPHAGRGAELRRPQQPAVHAGRRGRGAGRQDHRRRDLRQVQEVAGLLEVLRQHGADPAPHAPDQGAGRRGRAGGEAGELLLPAAAQQRREQLPLHVHGVRARHDQGPGPQDAGGLEQGGQRHPRPVQGVPATA